MVEGGGGIKDFSLFTPPELFFSYVLRYPRGEVKISRGTGGGGGKILARAGQFFTLPEQIPLYNVVYCVS